MAMGSLTGSVSHAQRQPASKLWPDEAKHGMFFFHADFKLEAIAPLLKQTALLQDELEKTLAVKLQPRVIHVFLFRKRLTYERYLQYYFPSVPTRPAMFIQSCSASRRSRKQA